MPCPPGPKKRSNLYRTPLIFGLLGLLVASGFLVHLSTAPVAPGVPHHGASATAAPASISASTSSASPASPRGSDAGFPDYYPPHIGPSAGGGLIGNCSAPSTGPVIPGCGYYKEAAPMGIADYGVSGYGNPTPYAYSTTEFVGVTSWSKAYFYNASLTGETTYFTVQLNVMLDFIAGAGSGQNYTYWIQDVAVPDDATKNTFDMSYENNIWNMSTTIGGGGYVPIPSGTLSGNGSVQGTEYYYDGASGTGSGDVLTSSQFSLVVISTIVNGRIVVRFCYDDPTMSSLVCYDSVTFSSATIIDKDNNFLVDGYTMNQMGLFEDAELTIGGPGGGSYTKNTGPTDLQTSLYFWNGHNLQTVPSAYNMGDNTAESVTADQAIPSQDGSGLPLTTHLNGTTRDDKLTMDYSEPMLGTLAAWDSGTTGSVSVGTDSWSYLYGWAQLPLQPGTYGVWINESTPTPTSTNMGLCTITANTVTNITAGTPCTATGGGNPTVSSPTASRSSADVGQSVTFTSTLTGAGTAPDTYGWTVSPTTGLGCVLSTSLTMTCTPTNSNIYSVTITVTDSLGHTGSATLTGYIVYPDPTVAVPVGAPPTIQIGQTVVFSSTLGLPGSGTDTYAWTASAPGLGCAASTTLSYSCTPTIAATYTVTITVTDSNKGTGSNTSASYIVTPTHPVVTTPVSTPHSSADIGQWVNFTSTLSNPGAGAPVTYVWTVTPASGLGCLASTTLQLTCIPTAVGTYSVMITATDSKGNTGTATLSPFQVYADPSISGVTSSPAQVDVTQNVQFTAGVGNPGSGGDVFGWITPNGLGCAGSSTDVDLCKTTSAGTFLVKVSLTDSNGWTAHAELNYTVVPDPTVTSPTPSPAAVVVGQSVTWTTTSPFPGTGGDTYSWSVSPTVGLGCGTSTTTTWVCTPTGPGSYTVSVVVTDGTGATSSASSAPMTVTEPTQLTATLTANVTSGPVSLSVQFSATASGGVPSYTYTWRFGDGSPAVIGVSVSHTYNARGTFVADLWVNDSAVPQNSVLRQQVITVNNAPAPPPVSNNNAGSSGGWGSYWWLILLVAAVAAAAIVGLAYSRHRKRKMEESENASWDGYAPSPMGGGYAGAGAAAAGGGLYAAAAPGPGPGPSPAPAPYMEPPAAMPPSDPSSYIEEPAATPPPASPPAPSPSPAARAPPAARPPPATQEPLPDSDKGADEMAPDPNHWVSRPAKRPPPVPPQPASSATPKQPPPI
jgi:PKD repeat protein